MRLVRYLDGRAGRIGVEGDDGAIRPTPFDTLNALIADGRDGGRLLRAAGHGEPLTSEPKLLSPLTGARTMLFCGVNFESHLVENPAAQRPAEPFFFAKLAGAIIGPGDPIDLADADVRLDLEVELAAIVGTPIRRASRAEAAAAIFGYTVANDLSDRRLQFEAGQLTLGKGRDTFSPLGPAVVTADAIDVGNLAMASWIDGDLMQSATTAECFSSIVELVAFASRFVTLAPGDVVTSGTPGGVGHFRRPPVYIQPGSTVSVQIEGIGRLSNPVVRSA